MASATAIAKAEDDEPDLLGERPPPARRPRSRLRPALRLPGTRLGRLIIGLNLIGLLVLIAGALVLNELRRGLVDARIDSLTTQGELMTAIIDRAATVGEPEPRMDAAYAAEILQMLANPKSQRARLFDAEGREIADSDWVADRVETRLLPPARARGEQGGLQLQILKPKSQPRRAEQAAAALRAEVAEALTGRHRAGLRQGERGERIVSVSIPIQHVQAVLGVLTLEARDVDAIVARERVALIPFILIAIATSLASSLLLNSLIARPVIRLARAADRVRLSRARAMSLPDLARREDELGDLTRALEAMTEALSEQMDAVESFAADVAHEIRNPLTSLRSAVETLDLVTDPAARERLLKVLQNDVQRLDRLVTDISNASRLDAELSREPPKPVDLERLARDVIGIYQAAAKPGEPTVAFTPPKGLSPVRVAGREGPLGQIIRNLIDNARSFSPPGGVVDVTVATARDRVMVLVADQGPGIPPDNLETIFQRFYTSRPKGAAFGGNSGLGLSIARQIAQAHGGSLQARNIVDTEGQVKGALFVLSLPKIG